MRSVIKSIRKLRSQVADELDDAILRSENQSANILQDSPPELWAEDRLAIADNLYSVSRHYLKLALVQRITEDYADRVGFDRDSMPYQKYFVPPAGYHNLLDYAEHCLRLACSLNPNHYGAQFNLGVVLERKGKLDEAIDRFRAATGVNSPVCTFAHWRAGSILHRMDRNAEAVADYSRAIELDPHQQGIYRSDLAALLRERGCIEQSLEHFDRAIEFDHIMIPEFRYFSNSGGAIQQPAKIDPPTVELIDGSGVPRKALNGEAGDIYLWCGRYYAVPRTLKTISPLDLTQQGFLRQGFSGSLDRVFGASPILLKLCRPLLRPICRGLYRRADRRRIRSAASAEEIADGVKLGGLADLPEYGLIDPNGLTYDIYQSARLYFAIPRVFGVPHADELTGRGLYPGGWRAIVEAVLDRFPIVHRLGRNVLRRIVPGVVRRYERRRIRSAMTAAELRELVVGPDPHGKDGRTSNAV